MNDWVDVQDFFAKPQELSEALTQAGLEVESIENQRAQFEFVKVGLILKKEAHPEAYRLSVCQVSTGQGVVHQIVCGAKNHQENDRVVVALPGAQLANGLKIKTSVLRNIESKGMLCSRAELGLAGDAEGLLILGPEAPVGEDFSQFWGLNDILFELKVTPNRADCLSHLGLAREVACLLSRPLKKDPAPLGEIWGAKALNQKLPVSVLETTKTHIYLGVELHNVQVGPSPAWLVQKLESVGLKSINNVVDVTNYIMMDWGQPLHAFDRQKMNPATLQVRWAQAGESLLALDGKTYELQAEDVVIADEDRCLALAGVIGGQDSAIEDKTTHIFLEAAVFDSARVRKSSRRLGLQTDSCYRFSRGVDASHTMAALAYAIECLQQVAGGQWVAPVSFYQQPKSARPPIVMAVSEVSARLGFKVEAPEFESLMDRLQISWKLTSVADKYELLVPSWRFDLEQSVDIVEECGRLLGYHRIPEALPSLNAAPRSHHKEYLQSLQWEWRARALGFSQVVLPGLISGVQEQEFWGENFWSQAQLPWSQGQAVALLNPLSEQGSHLRSSLAYGLFETLLHNLRQGQSQGALFEIGPTVRREGEGRYVHFTHFAAVVWGEPVQVWEKQQKAPLVLQLVEKVRALNRGMKVKKVEDRNLYPSFMHRGQSAFVYHQQNLVGVVGSLHPQWLEAHKIRVPVAFVELQLDKVWAPAPENFRFQNFSRYPKVERDLALMVPRNISHARLEEIFYQALGSDLKSIVLFDIYEDAQRWGEGLRQLAYRFELQREQSTLTELEINERMNNLVTKLNDELGVYLREA